MLRADQNKRQYAMKKTKIERVQIPHSPQSKILEICLLKNLTFTSVWGQITHTQYGYDQSE